MSGPESVGEILGRNKKVLGGKRSWCLKVITERWQDIAGERLGEHTLPRRISRGTLYIAADGPTWASECQLQSEYLRGKIERIIGDGFITKIKVQSRHKLLGRRFEKEETAFKKIKYDVELPNGKMAELGSIEDERVRESLSKLIAISTAKQNEQKHRNH